MPAKLTIKTKSREWTHDIPDDGSALVGRSSRTNVQILDKAASGLHFEIRGAENEWTIKDLKSTNGTYLNGRKIEVSRLSDGDVVRVGSAEIVFSVARPAASALPDVDDKTGGKTADDETELAQAVKGPKKKKKAKVETEVAKGVEPEPVEVLKEIEQEFDALDEIEDLDSEEEKRQSKTEPTQPAPPPSEDEDKVETEEDIADLDEAGGEENNEEIIDLDDDDVELLEIE